MTEEQDKSKNKEGMPEDGWTYLTFPPFENEKYIFRQVDEGEEITGLPDLSEYLEVTTRIFYIGMPTLEKRYFIPRRLFGQLFSNWDDHAEEVIRVESVSKEKAEEELEDFEYHEPLI